jgi:hypothetical protein
MSLRDDLRTLQGFLWDADDAALTREEIISIIRSSAPALILPNSRSGQRFRSSQGKREDRRAGFSPLPIACGLEEGPPAFPALF